MNLFRSMWSALFFMAMVTGALGVALILLGVIELLWRWHPAAGVLAVTFALLTFIDLMERE